MKQINEEINEVHGVFLTNPKTTNQEKQYHACHRTHNNEI